jgi:hypothetical protein
MTAVATAWLISFVPAISALFLWSALGGHIYVLEAGNLVLGHLLYGLLIAAIALAAAAIAESSATAAIITLAVTIGSWVLDFALAGQPGIWEWLSRSSLTQTLRPFEQGLLPLRLVLGLAAAISGCATIAAAWIHPGVPIRSKLIRSIVCIAAVALAFALAANIRTTLDLTEDQRNSFPPADQRALQTLREPLEISVHLAPEDPRYSDLRRNVLAKLERILPKVSIRIASAGQSVIGSTSEEYYGEIEYAYADRSTRSRSTSEGEILPLIYELAGLPPPAPATEAGYPGYPLVANGSAALVWFLGVLPVLIGVAWWLSSRVPRTLLKPVDSQVRGIEGV